MVPNHLKYTAEHEWALVTETGTVRFGITDFAQESLGDIVFVTLPDPGAELAAGNTCGEVESTKSVSDIYCPVAGTVALRNDVVETSPETINTDPYGAGWLLEVAPTDPDPLSGLLDATAYTALITAG